MIVKNRLGAGFNSVLTSDDSETCSETFTTYGCYHKNLIKFAAEKGEPAAGVPGSPRRPRAATVSGCTPRTPKGPTVQDAAETDVQRAERSLREATKRFEEAQAGGDRDRIQAAKREMERGFNELMALKQGAR